MTGDQGLAAVARRMIAMRKQRKTFFPNEIFDEYGWNMLLELFVAHADNVSLSEARLVQLAGTTSETGRRWVRLLVEDGQARVTGDDVMLTADAVDRLRRFFREQESVTA